MLDKIVDFLPYLLGVFVIGESYRIMVDLSRLKTIGEVKYTKHEWGQMIQVPMIVLTVLMSVQQNGMNNKYEIPVYIGIMIVTIIRIVMGSKVAEEGILMSSRVCMYDDIKDLEYENIAEKHIKIKVPSNINNNRLRTFKLKVSGKEKNMLLEQFRAHGIEKKGIDHNNNESNQ